MKGGSNNTKEIYFIRHGETEWNKLGMSQGSEADIELNETGRKQALLTGKYLDKFRNN
jgi:broad specificity phosphatase PhoE